MVRLRKTRLLLAWLIIAFFGIVTIGSCPDGCSCSGTGTVICSGRGELPPLDEIPNPDQVTDMTLSNYRDVGHNVSFLCRFAKLDRLQIRNCTIAKVMKLPRLLQQLEIVSCRLEEERVSRWSGRRGSCCFRLRFLSGEGQLRKLTLDSNNIHCLQNDSFFVLIQLQSLKMRHNNLNSIMSDTFRNLISLTWLDLSHNKLTILPVTLFDNTRKLTHLDLSDNQLVTIPNLSNLPKVVKHLNFANNKLNNLDFLLGFASSENRKVPGLFLHGNEIENIPTRLFKKISVLWHLSLSSNKIPKLTSEMFAGCTRLAKLDLSYNNISVIQANSFHRLNNLHHLDLGYNKLSSLPTSLFKNMLNLTYISLIYNRLTSVPDLSGLPNWIFSLGLSFNNIKHFGNLLQFASTGRKKTVIKLYLRANRIETIPLQLFQRLSVGWILDLSRNMLHKLTNNMFSACMKLYNLGLGENNIAEIQADAFQGLNNVVGLYLQNNNISVVPNGLFRHMPNLNILFLQQNNLRNLSAMFSGNQRSPNFILLYGNPIMHLLPSFLSSLTVQSELHIDCKGLSSLPRNLRSNKILCGPSNSFVIQNLLRPVAEWLEEDGFECWNSKTQGHNFRTCIPCEVGTYQHSYEGTCTKCPPGSFYQDELAQAHCKLCPYGQFVPPNNAPGKSPLDCKTCPHGTRTDKLAGTRACDCLNGFARTDRFGHCTKCQTKGVQCKDDYQILDKGFWWDWSFNSSSKFKYMNFIENIKISTKYYDQEFSKFSGILPTAHICRNYKACLGGVNADCHENYTGPLCAVCNKSYYKKSNFQCLKCPELRISVLKCLCIFLLFIITCIIINWADKKKIITDDGQTRTVADMILSILKIFIGFYQVMTGMIHSMNYVNWPVSLQKATQVIRLIQFQILDFPSLKCIHPELGVDAIREFWLSIGATIAVPILIFILYLIKILDPRTYYCKKSSSRLDLFGLEKDLDRQLLFPDNTGSEIIGINRTKVARKSNMSTFSLCHNCRPETDEGSLSCSMGFHEDLQHSRNIKTHFKQKCLRAILLFLFVTYPFTSERILELMPQACHTLCIQNSGDDFKSCVKRVSYLKSDYSVQCLNVDPNHSWTLKVAYGTLIIPFGFPIILLLLIYKQKRNGNNQVNFALRFCVENYKDKYWYWEAIEMLRKLLLTSALILFGLHSKFHLGLSVAFGGFFAVLFAYTRPIKDKHEHYLQMISLTVIFINLCFGTIFRIPEGNIPDTVDKSTDNIAVSVALIFLNFLLIGSIIFMYARAVYFRFKEAYQSILFL